MKKILKNKKGEGKLIIVGAFILLGVLIYFGFFASADIGLFRSSVVGYDDGRDMGNSALYKISFSNPGGYVPACFNGFPEIGSTPFPSHSHIIIPSPPISAWDTPFLVQNTQLNTIFNTTDITLSTGNIYLGTGGHCGNTAAIAKIVNASVSCSVSSYYFGNTGKFGNKSLNVHASYSSGTVYGAVPRCTLDFDVIAVDSNGNMIQSGTMNMYGYVDVGTINVEIPKIGIQCTNSQMSLCKEGDSCINNQCVSPSVSNLPTSNNSPSQSSTPLEDSVKKTPGILGWISSQWNKFLGWLKR